MQRRSPPRRSPSPSPVKTSREWRWWTPTPSSRSTASSTWCAQHACERCAAPLLAFRRRRRRRCRLQAAVRCLCTTSPSLVTAPHLQVRFADKCVTTPEVLREVRDKQSRAALAALPFTIETREPAEESIKAGERCSAACRLLPDNCQLASCSGCAALHIVRDNVPSSCRRCLTGCIVLPCVDSGQVCTCHG